MYRLKPALVIFIFYVCQAALAQTNTWIQIDEDIDGEAPGDRFGFSVSLSGNGLVVAGGGPFGGSDNSGTVGVFELVNDTFLQRGPSIEGAQGDGRFGFSVSLNLDGSVLAVGATAEGGAGVVKVFEYNGTDYLQRGQDILGTEAGDEFGFSVALSAPGDVLAVGAINELSTGNVHVYGFNGDNYVQRGTALSGANIDGRFGFSVALSRDGSVLAVGSSPPEADDRGTVHVYGFENPEYRQRGDALTGDAGDQFGYSVALTGDGRVLAAGAIASTAPGFSAGQVRIFEISSNEISERAVLNGEKENAEFGSSVSFSDNGSVLAVGSRGSSEVRAFAFNNEEYLLLGPVIIGEETKDEAAVVSISQDGSVLAIGGNLNDNLNVEAGQVRVFEFAPETFAPTVEPPKPGEHISGALVGGVVIGTLAFFAWLLY